LSILADFNVKEVENVFNAIIAEKNMKLGNLAQPVRVALTGGTVSPGIFEMIEAMGKELAVKRLRQAAEFIASKP
jgi:glutamyl-tRNA synthetase